MNRNAILKLDLSTLRHAKRAFKIARPGCFRLLLITLLGMELTGMLRAQATPPGRGVVRIGIVGDSTVSCYPAASSMRGWGQMLSAWLLPETVLLNEAECGRSSKTFPAEKWRKILLEKPDFVLIQFGHNDSHAKDRPEATDAATEYKDNLRRYIREARAAGIAPVLVTPPHRRIFLNGQITQELLPYVCAMKEVSAESNVPLIDLYLKSGELFQSLGEAGSSPFTVNVGMNAEPGAKEDRTHFTETGARALAEQVAKSFPDIDARLGDLLLPASR